MRLAPHHLPWPLLSFLFSFNLLTFIIHPSLFFLPFCSNCSNSQCFNSKFDEENRPKIGNFPAAFRDRRSETITWCRVNNGRQTIGFRSDTSSDDHGHASRRRRSAFRIEEKLEGVSRQTPSQEGRGGVDLHPSGSGLRCPDPNEHQSDDDATRYPSDPNVDSLDAEGTRQLGRQRSVRLLPLETDPEEEKNEDNSPKNENKSPAREEGGLKSQTSLMALLQDYAVEDEGEHHDVEAVEEVVVEEEDEIGGDYNVCCGCRGKHKDAAVGPCGHTFCKSCTRELHVSRNQGLPQPMPRLPSSLFRRKLSVLGEFQAGKRAQNPGLYLPISSETQFHRIRSMLLPVYAPISMYIKEKYNKSGLGAPKDV
ncbi:hypothetical protein OSB04_023132 [Centaurea solstitialis]|uniref:RING-type domain-containing protein n=1 Tax=Centaurea solstitialis TaxID=347529 RepID=A0AA38W944_9ASTR|nr:hypothetical protein OSB04_023132 [Centaurea solstitialis]